MEKKPAFVFDTNFIVQTQELDKVLENLKDKYTVYVPQMCIEERIAQQCREERKLFDDVENMQKRCAKIASVNFKMSYEERAENLRNGVQEKYERWFGNNIIPFSKDEKTFQRVLGRAYQKQPPFSTADNASDKGFKDAIVWISLLDYFQKHTNMDVIFVTNDKGFLDNISWLCTEFHTETKNNIEIKHTNYYKELTENQSKQAPCSAQKILPNIGYLREEINSVLNAIRIVEIESTWNGPQYDYPFFINQKVDDTYMKAIFENLGNVIESHIFDLGVSADEVLELDNRVVNNNNVDIPLDTLESVIKLYGKIKEQYTDYISQFYATAANVINQNYREPLNDTDTIDYSLPF